MTSACSSSTTGRLVLRRGGDRDDLLGEDVEGVARHDGRLDAALAHELDDDRALEEVGAELGEDAALRGVPDRVAGAADALQAAGDGLRRLDLEHEVDGAHVDAELERRRRHEARQVAGLQQLLHDRALLAGERAVVGAGDLLERLVVVGAIGVGQLVEAQREPLRHAAVVHEDDRRPVLPDELEHLRVDRGPDRAPRRLAARDRIERVEVTGGLLGLDHRLDGHLDLQVQRLADARVDDGARAPRPDHEAADLLERVLRRREADALVLVELRHALERQRGVAAALRRGDRVDLVHDRPLHALEHVARLRGEDEVERLRRRDEDVRRAAAHRLALALRRVAGADRDLDVGPDAAQRRPQVALDVVGQRLERRDVDEARVAVVVGQRIGGQAVDAPEEGGERLARAGGRGDQRVRPGGDGRPGLRLHGGRLRERVREPVANTGGEGIERSHLIEGTRAVSLRA